MRSFTLGGAQYDGVIFDCDGVLLDSNGLKIVAFQDCARDFGFDESAILAFTRWQSANFGTSRYRVFERLLGGDFGPVPPGVTLQRLLDTFGARVRSGYLSVPEAKGTSRLLEILEGVPLYVASGSDERELREVFESRGLADKFRAVRGSPSPKARLVREICEDSSMLSPLFVGDAHADADAAQENSIDFVFVSGLSTVAISMSARAHAEGYLQFHDLAEFAAAIGDTTE